MLAKQLVVLASSAFALAASSTTNPYATYPQVPKTASINGFADRIYGQVDACAKKCLDDTKNTGATPCPYWDTGCLCVMSNWGNTVADCVAANCQGSEVQVMTSLASSLCSSAGVPSPFWFMGDAQKTALSNAAAATPSAESSDAPSSAAPSSAAPSSEAPSSAAASSAAPESSADASSAPESVVTASSDSAITSAPDSSSSTTNPYATYPQVPKTASINGFADRIYGQVGECAKKCLDDTKDTSVTPCPYWDTGCLCVMSMWGNGVADCVAASCKGEDVVSMTSLASSACSSAGVPSPFWFMGGPQKAALDSAAAATPSESSDAPSSEAPSSVVTESSAAPSSVAESSAVESSVTSAVESSAITSAPDSSSTTNPYATYPQVPKTATLNGFADRIYEKVGECAQKCLEDTKDTSMTPCPYWDTGCLCVMSMWGNGLADCVASSCKGEEVVSMTSLASSACSSAGVPSPFWFLGGPQKAALESAASATESSAAPSSEAPSSVVTESSAVESSAVTSAEESSAITSAPESSSSTTNPYATYPQVPKTATINGFADRIFDKVGECAQKCLEETKDTSMTPCPYWDTGCLCVMSMWGNGLADCVAANCQGEEVVSMTSLASSACSSAGVPSPFWFLGGPQKAALDSAASATPTESSAAPSADVSSVVTESSAVTSADESSAITSAPDSSSSTTNPYATFPPVPKTATINGFADRIYEKVGECAQKCLEETKDTSMTPCPYWDTGCLCVMSMWGNGLADCVAANCQGEEVVSMTSLASSACSSAGVPSPFWFLGGPQKSALDSAAAAGPTDSATPSSGASSAAPTDAESSGAPSSVVTESSAAPSSGAESSALPSDSTSTAATASNPAVPTGAEIITNITVSDSSVGKNELINIAVTVASEEPLEDGTTTQFTIPGIFFDYLSPIEISTVEGVPVGTVTGDAATNVFTIQFNDWAASHRNIEGTFTFNVRLSYTENLQKRAIDTVELTTPIVVIPVVFAAPGKSFTAEITINVLDTTEAPAAVAPGSTDVFSGESIQSGSQTATGTGAGSSVTNGDEVTSTNTHHTIVTVTSCSDNKCVTKESTAIVSTATATVDGTETVYTTWCPEETETKKQTTTVTVTSCADNKCSAVTSPAHISKTTATVNGKVTTITTWCPITTEEPKTTQVTVTKCADNKCVTSASPVHVSTVTENNNGKVTTRTTYVAITSTVAPGTKAPEGTNAPGTKAPEGTAAPGTKAPQGTNAPGASSAAPSTVAPQVVQGSASNYGLNTVMFALSFLAVLA